MNDTPTAIKLNVAENQLTITWGDRHISRYSGGWLRFICPCAGCRGHAPGEVPPPTWEASKDVRCTGAEAVGHYALRLALSDGHDSGVYSFERLRANEPTDPEAWLRRQLPGSPPA